MEGKKTINSHANTPQKSEVGDDGRQGRPTHRGGGGMHRGGDGVGMMVAEGDRLAS